MRKTYDAFYRDHFTPQRYRAYQEAFEARSGKRYTLSTGPCLLDSAIASRIREQILPAFVKLLNADAYKARIYDRGWFLPAVPVTLDDFFGSIDFHINGDDVRLIELNFFLPGHIGFIELFPTLFSEHFAYPAEPFAAGFEQRLAAFLKQRFGGGKIALAVNRLGLSAHYFEHYRYIEKFLRANGVDARVVFAKDAGISPDGRPVWGTETFDGVFNIVIPRIWEHHPEEFRRYTALFEAAPERFFPNPWCWTMGDKRFLTVLSDLAPGDFGLDAEEVAVLRSVTLKTKPLTAFGSVEALCDCFGGPENLVLKPIDNFHTQGVYIRPPAEKIAEVFETEAERYVAQELFWAEAIYNEDAEGRPQTPWYSQLRTEFFRGEFLNFRAYGYGDPFGLSPMMPVVIR